MNRMRELRKKKGLTMKALGKLVGVAESTISLYETGKHEPDVTTLLRIANILGVTTDELLTGNTPEKTESGNIAIMIDQLSRLSPEDQQRVIDFAQGILSARGQSSAPHN